MDCLRLRLDVRPNGSRLSCGRRARGHKDWGGHGAAHGSSRDHGQLRSGALALPPRSRLAPLQLGFGSRLLLRRLTRGFGPRLTARRRSLAARLGARWRGLSAPPLFRGRAALRFRRPRRLLGPVAPLGTWLVPVIGLIRPVAMIGLVGPTTVPAIVIPLVF